MSRGIKGRSLAADGTELGAPVFLLPIKSFGASDSSLNLVQDAAFKFKIITAWVVMNGAGDSFDTVKLTDGTDDITDTLDVSSAGDTDLVSFGELDDAYATIEKGGDVVAETASGALVDVYALCVKIEG
jgi:hypothetical protein